MQLLRITFASSFIKERFTDASDFTRDNQTEQAHDGVLEVSNATLIHIGSSQTDGTCSELYRGELRIEGKDSDPEPVVVEFKSNSWILMQQLRPSAMKQISIINWRHYRGILSRSAMVFSREGRKRKIRRGSYYPTVVIRSGRTCPK